LPPELFTKPLLLKRGIIFYECVMLKEAIISVFGSEAKLAESQHPASVATCVVPRDRFSEAAKGDEEGLRPLAAEWAADETALGRGTGFLPVTGGE